MTRGPWLIGIAVILVTLVLVPRVEAQPASPAASPVPLPSVECTVEPRPVEDFLAIADTPGPVAAGLLGTPVVTPSLPAEAAPAAPAEIEAVTATMNEIIACLNAGENQRLASLYTDEFFREFFGGIGSEGVAFLTGTPTPLPTGVEARLDEMTDIRSLPDGRVAAVVRMNESRNLIIFAEEDGRYLLDDSFELPDAATPTP